MIELIFLLEILVSSKLRLATFVVVTEFVFLKAVVALEVVVWLVDFFVRIVEISLLLMTLSMLLELVSLMRVLLRLVLGLALMLFFVFLFFAFGSRDGDAGKRVVLRFIRGFVNVL